jgi:hypothetical protein
MANIVVSVINHSEGVVTDDACRALVAALQVQVSRDFAPVWGVDATLTFVPNDAKPEPGTWWLTILKNSDRGGALGYHDLTPDGLPIAKSFAGDDKEWGHLWTVTASHELLEMLADPHVNLTVFIHPTQDDRKLYTYEICDPCQDDQFAYEIGDVKVCDFVYPVYFQSIPQPANTQFDHLRRIQKPVPALLEFGYINAFDLNSGKDWHPIEAATTGGKPVRGRSPGRREKRVLPRQEWKRSTIFA